MQHKFLEWKDGSKIAYEQIRGRLPGVVFLGGFMSDMSGIKASHLASICQTNDRMFTRFDYFGHGLSSGEFIEGTVGRWKEDALAVLDQLTEGPQILVGSSMGGWIMMLVASQRKERIAGLVGVAVAPDFTRDLTGRLVPYQEELKTKGVCYISSHEEKPYPISQQLITEAKNHYILETTLPIACPVRFLHGLGDETVSWQQSLKLMQSLESKDARLILIKEGDHRLSKPDELSLLSRTVFELL